MDWDQLDSLDYSDTIPKQHAKSVLKQRKEQLMNTPNNRLNLSNLKQLSEISSMSKFLPELGNKRQSALAILSTNK